MQYPGQHQQCDDCLFWGSAVICAVCVAILQNLIFIYIVYISISILVFQVNVFVAEAGSGRVKAVNFS